MSWPPSAGRSTTRWSQQLRIACRGLRCDLLPTTGSCVTQHLSLRIRKVALARLLLAIVLGLLASVRGSPAVDTDADAEAVSVERLEWRAFRPAAGGFRVSLPGTPAEHASTHMTIIGRIGSTAYVVKPPGWEFRVEQHAIPWIARSVVSPVGLVERAATDFLRDFGGRALSTSDEPWRGHPARRLTYAVDNAASARGTALFVFAGTRLYILDVTRLAGDLPPETVTRFFDSFELVDG